MKFSVASTLSYTVHGPSTLLCSLKCVYATEGVIENESLTADRPVKFRELPIGLAANRFTMVIVDEPGPLNLQYAAVVESCTETTDASKMSSMGIRDLRPTAIPYLFPSRYSPSDGFRDVATSLFGGLPSPYLQVMAIEDWLFENITYELGSSSELTCAGDTYQNRVGVCRDFAHLGIALCRALTIPARYVTVYAHDLEPPDFHAVFEAFIDGIWYLVDGTRKAPLNGMVRIAVGRDASDAAVATLFGDVQGNGVQVSSQYAVTNSVPFTPLTRESLLHKNEALYIA